MSQNSLQLGFKAFDLHELFPHFVARELGYYRDAGLKVSLRDTTFLPESDWPPKLFSTACGSAFLSSLMGGDQKILVGAIQGPFFWLAASPGVSWEALSGTRIASFPFMAPPHVFLRVLLREEGLDPDRDVQLEAVRDDVGRLGLLREGEVSAALLSSNIVPSAIKSAGLEILSFLGDRLYVPTSGLSVRAGKRPPAPLLEALQEAYRRALQAIREEAPGVVAVQEKWLPAMKSSFGRWMRSLYVVDNAYDSGRMLDSAARLARELGAEAPRSTADFFLH